jgi:hypothetical protein
MKERWLLAMMTPPVFGIFACPVTHGRKAVRRRGPTTRFFMSQ